MLNILLSESLHDDLRMKIKKNVVTELGTSEMVPVSSNALNTVAQISKENCDFPTVKLPTGIRYIFI